MFRRREEEKNHVFLFSYLLPLYRIEKVVSDHFFFKQHYNIFLSTQNAHPPDIQANMKRKLTEQRVPRLIEWCETATALAVWTEQPAYGPRLM